MAGKRIVRASILLLVSALLLLLLGPGSGVKATNWDTSYSTILSDNTPGANADQTTVYMITQLGNNFSQIISATSYPEANIALDSQIPDGSSVGSITNEITLSIFNGPCITPITVTIPLMDCTTDTLDTVPSVGSGDNLVQDNDNDMNEDGFLATEGITLADCKDGIDNDADTLVDYDDPDCIGDCIDGINNNPPLPGACLNDIDDDGDTNVNDGCPAVGAPEDPSCVNAIDDGEDTPPDGAVNDGCPIKGDFADCDSNEDGFCDVIELVQYCFNAVDDDGDTRVNDGCWAVGVSEADADECADDVDDDGDTRVNDGCPAKGSPEEGNDLIDGADPYCNNEPEDTNGIPSYCDHYPAFLNDMYDPDGPGAAAPIRPRARYAGHQVVLPDQPVTLLDLVIFNPEALSAMPGIEGQMGDTFGFIGFLDPHSLIDFMVPDNPIQPPAPSIITDSCTPLTSVATLLGVSDGEWQVTPGPAPYEVGTWGQCFDGMDNDGDTWLEDGCLSIPDPCDGADNDGDTLTDEGCGYVRSENPAPLTGLFGTGTHVVRTYTQSQRDVDDDGISNNLDSCPYTVNTGTDADWDGLDSACDPDDTTPSLGAPPPDGVDNDSDCPNDDSNGNTVPCDCIPGPPRSCDMGVDEDPVDNADNDGDTLVDEDGECWLTQGIPDQDQDCYPNRQDICPLVADNQSDTDNPPGTAADLGPALDAIGDACDASPGTADGHYHVAMPIVYVCIPDPQGADDWDSDGDSDDDDDGICDSTEVLLGSDPEDVNSTPEHIALDLEIATGTAAEAPGTCSDYSVYNHPDSPAGGYDNDGDTLANAADPDCASIANDADDDGVADSVDNCPNDKNPEQVDSNGDGEGDVCDIDDDGDGVSDDNENCMGTDPKDDSADSSSDDANPFDFNNDTVVDVTDAGVFLAKFPSAVTNPGDARYNFNLDAPNPEAVDVTDAGIFLAKFPSDTKTSITLTNDSGSPADGVDIQFYFSITAVRSATDSDGGTWTLPTTLPDYSIHLDRTTGSLSAGGTLTISLVGLRHPVPMTVTWSP